MMNNLFARLFHRFWAQFQFLGLQFTTAFIRSIIRLTPSFFVLFLVFLMASCATNKAANTARRCGLVLDENTFGQTKVFMRLDTARAHVAPATSLRRFCPRAGNQGEQESCVAWSSAYAAQTIWQAQTTHQQPNKIAFSPSFVYNQLQHGACKPVIFSEAMKVLEQGMAPLSSFPYNEKTCAAQPSVQLKTEAERYRISGFQRLTRSDTDMTVDTIAIKQHIAQGIPVLIGALVTDSFSELTEPLWEPPADDAVQGGHAMCIVGYDDKKYGGAFELMNSWGTEWGEKGFAWVRYADFSRYGKEAYALFSLNQIDSMGAKMPEKQALSLKIALRDSANATIPLQKQANGYVYAPAQEPKAAMQFKVEVQNSKACFLYIFRRTAANKYEILYPKTALYSAYCGITGERLFPQKGNLSINDRHNSEEIAVIAAQTELDYNALNAALQTGKGSYTQRLAAALKLDIHQIKATNEGDFISLNATSPQTPIIAGVVQVQKMPVAITTEAPKSAPIVEDFSNRRDTIFVSIANKTSRNGYLEFDVQARGSNLRGGGNYVSSMEVELTFDPQMYNTATASQPIELTAGKNFERATKVGKDWKPSYHFDVRKISAGRVRVSMLMNDYGGVTALRGAVANTPLSAMHVRIPLANSNTKSSMLQFAENPNVTVGTYVLDPTVPYGDSKRYLFHIFAPVNGVNDLKE